MSDDVSAWWQQGIIYQIYPRSFADSNGDGIGDLRGIIGRLDYLSNTLGIDAIWLSPFYPSPMADFGYDVSNYVDIHPIFGDLNAFDDLLAQAHARGVKLIVDFVPNHTSDQHPWFLESRSSRHNPKRDWYVWRDARADGSPPNNWLSNFGGPAWEWDEATNQHYLHSFLKEQPDLNWRNPAVEAAMLDVLRFWLERGVDGFRIDVAHAIMKDPELRDNPSNPTGENARVPGRPYDLQLHLYDKGHPDVHEAFRTIRGVLDSFPPANSRMAVGEIYENDWTTWASYYGGGLDELHMPFNFALLNIPWTAEAIRIVVDSTEAAIPPGGWPNYVLGNHDRHRVASRIGAEQARLAMMLLLTLRGTPTIYNGDELGMHDVPVSPDQVHDHWELHEPGLGLGRDPERTPMQWDSGPNAGFCSPALQPWLPLAADYKQQNVAIELNEPRSMLTLTRALLKTRRATAALRDGSYRPMDDVPGDCFVYLREVENQRYLIALNVSAMERTVSLPSFGPGRVSLSTHLDRAETVDLADLRLRPDEGCLIELPA